jgi:hypothetical protein
MRSILRGLFRSVPRTDSVGQREFMHTILAAGTSCNEEIVAARRIPRRFCGPPGSWIAPCSALLLILARIVRRHWART